MKLLKKRCSMLTETEVTAASILSVGAEQLEGENFWASLPEDDDLEADSALDMDTIRLFHGHRKVIPDLHEELPSQSLSIDLLDLSSAEFDG